MLQQIWFNRSQRSRWIGSIGLRDREGSTRTETFSPTRLGRSRFGSDRSCCPSLQIYGIYGSKFLRIDGRTSSPVSPWSVMSHVTSAGHVSCMSHIVTVGNANRLVALPTVWWLPTDWWYRQQTDGIANSLLASQVTWINICSPRSSHRKLSSSS